MLRLTGNDVDGAVLGVVASHDGHLAVLAVLTLRQWVAR